MFPITDPIIIFALVTCLILVIPFLMEKVHMPALVGLLLAGAILGPNALHVLERDQSFILLGNVGLIFIMFIAALEVDLGVFKKFGIHSIVFGTLTFGLPIVAATPVALHVLKYEWLSAVLLASIFSSHTLLAYPMASKFGISKNRAVTTAVGGTMIADTAALLLLAVVVGLKAEGKITETFWWRLGGSLAIYVSLIFFGLPKLGRWLFRRVREDGNAQFLFVLSAVFVCAALSHSAGVEPIVGAFLAGMAMNRLIPHNGTLMNRIVFTGEAIFIPFFLISVGMLLDARVLFTGFATWIIVIYMTVMVLITKFLAAESTRLVLRFTKAEARVVFSLTLAQAAATLAVVQVGFNIGLFDETVVNGSIVMILATCTIAPTVMSRFGPEVAKHEVQLAAAEPEPERQRIMVGLPSLVGAGSIIDLALLLRDAAQRQPLYLVHAVRDDADAKTALASAEKMLTSAVSLCSSADVPAEIETSIDHTVGAALARASKEVLATHMVLGWECDRSRGQAVLGSTLDELLRTTLSTVVLFRSRHPVSTTQTVTLAIPPLRFDAEGFARAAVVVKRIAQQLGAPVDVLCDMNTWKAYEDAFRSAKPGVTTKHRRLETWDSLTQALLDRMSSSDLLIVLGQRDAPPPVARTIFGVAERFPDANIAMVCGAMKPESDLVVHVMPYSR